MKLLPNILSFFRICLVPLFVLAYVFDSNDVKYFAIAVFIVANISDVLDGIIARRYNAQTNMGKVLDPLGDKLLTFSALICIALTRPFLAWAPCLYFIKEVLMGIGGLIISKKVKIELPGANWLGKTATVIFFAVCFLLLVFNETFIPDYAALAMAAFAVLFMLVAFTRYLFTYIEIMKKRAAAPDEENTGSAPNAD